VRVPTVKIIFGEGANCKDNILRVATVKIIFGEGANCEDNIW
jgi:hypothetical protein